MNNQLIILLLVVAFNAYFFLRIYNFTHLLLLMQIMYIYKALNTYKTL